MEAIRTTLHAPFGEAVERVKSVFKDHGFGTLTQIDVQGTLKEKLGEEIEPYTILGVCNPTLASRAISTEHEIGLFLPCTVLVHECNGAVNISAQDPSAMVELSHNEALGPIAKEARDRITQAIASI